MSDFRTLKGLYIKHVSSDPSNIVKGDIWYNTTTQTLKVAPQVPGTWAAGENAPATARDMGGCGTTTAAAYFGGRLTSTGEATNATFEYDGTDYSTSGNLPNARSQLVGFGTQTAGVCVGHASGGALTEEYNGSTWAEGGDLNNGRTNGAGCGTLTAGLYMGGAEPPPGSTAIEEYDGSSWASNPNSLTTGRNNFAGVGTQTAALGAGGYSQPPATVYNNTEEYDGSAVSSGGDLNTARKQFRGTGTQTAGVVFGGSAPGATGATEEYDGSAWTTQGSMGTARYAFGAGSNSPQNTGVVMCGYTGTADQLATEEYTSGAAGIKSVDTT